MIQVNFSFEHIFQNTFQTKFRKKEISLIFLPKMFCEHHFHTFFGSFTFHKNQEKYFIKRIMHFIYDLLAFSYGLGMIGSGEFRCYSPLLTDLFE